MRQWRAHPVGGTSAGCASRTRRSTCTSGSLCWRASPSSPSTRVQTSGVRLVLKNNCSPCLLLLMSWRHRVTRAAFHLLCALAPQTRCAPTCEPCVCTMLLARNFDSMPLLGIRARPAAPPVYHEHQDRATLLVLHRHRYSALEVLFDTLTYHGSAFTPEFWTRIFDSVLLSIFDHVRAEVPSPLDASQSTLISGCMCTGAPDGAPGWRAAPLLSWETSRI